VVPVLSIFVYHDICRLFSREHFFFNEPGDLNSWFLETESPVAIFPKGNSVSHYAFNLAKYMNPSQIIFVGLDLAFPTKNAHSKNSANTWNLQDDTYFVMVPDINDCLLPTIPAFRDAITIFEAQIADTAIPCIDATEGGARIPGTRVMTLKEAIRIYLDGLDAAPLPLTELWKNAKKIDPSLISDKVEWFIASAREVESLSKQGMDTVSTILEDIDKHGPRHSRVIKGIDAANRLMDQIDGHTLYMALIRQRLDSVYISQYRTKFMIEREVEQKKKVIMQIASSKEYFSRINEATSILIRSREKAEIKRNTFLQSCKACGS